MQYDVNFSARLNASSPNVSKYTCACIASDGRSYMPATSANLSAAGGVVHGLFTDDSGPNGVSSIQVSGTVLGAMAAGLVAPGTTAAVGPNALGILSLSTSLAIGTVDAFGNVTLAAPANSTHAVSPVGAISVGQVCAKYGTSPTDKTIQVATPAVLAAGGAALFMATASASSGSTITAGGPGDKIDTTVTGLGAGLATRVGIDPVTYKAVRLLVSDGRPEIGNCDTAGNVTLSAVYSFSQTPSQEFNPASPKYGATYGDTTDPVILHANLVAWNRMCADIRRSSASQSHRIAITGILCLPDTAFVKGSYTIVGINGGANAQGPSMIKGSGTDEVLNICPQIIGVRIEDITINNTPTAAPSIFPTTPTAVAVGNKRRAPRDGSVQYKCVVAGTTASGALPAAFNKPNAVTPDRFSPGAMYAVGDTIFPPRSSRWYGFYAYTVTAANGSSVPGTLGFADEVTVPAWPTTINVIGAAAGAGGAVVLQTKRAHGFVTGDVVTVASVGGTTEANGSWTLTFVDATHVLLQGTTFVHAWTSGGVITTGAATVVSRELTFTPHALSDFGDSGVPTNDLGNQLQLFHGTSVWIAESISAVTSHSKTTMTSVSMNNSTCMGWDLYSALDGVDLVRCSVIGSNGSDLSGGGLGSFIRIHGFLGAGCSIRDSFCYSVGLDPVTGQNMPGQCGNAYEDDSLLGAVFLNCNVETATGRAFISDTIGQSTWINCYSDGNYLDNIYRNHAVVINGQDTSFSDDGTTLPIGARAFGSIFTFAPDDLQGNFPLHSAPIRNGGTGVWAWGSSHENGGLSFFETRHDNFFYGWSFESYCAGGSTTRQIEGWSGSRAAEGLGNKWALYGTFKGNFPNTVYDGYGPDCATDVRVRFGARKVGDSYRYNTAPVAGDFTHKIITGAGSVGNVTWAALNGTYVTSDYALGTPATCHSPGDGKTYMLTVDGATGASSPTWSASTLTGPRAKRWKTGLVTYPGDLWHDGAGHYFEVANPTFWTAALDVVPNGLVGVRAANSKAYDVFQAKIPRYASGAEYQLGTITQPTANGSRVAFQASAIVQRGVSATLAVDGPGAHALAGAEPTWPVAQTVTATSSGTGGVFVLTYGSAHGATTGDVHFVHGVGAGADGYQTVTVIDATHLSLNGTTYAAGYVSGGYSIKSTITVVYFGDPNYQITWTAIQLTTGATNPKWSQTTTSYEIDPNTRGVIDGNIVWTKVPLTTGPTEPTWVTTTPGTSLTTDTSTTVPFQYLYDGTFPTAALVTDGTCVWMRIDSVPTEACIGGRITNPGTLVVAASASITLTRDQAAYETVKLSSSGGSITVASPYDGQIIRIYNPTTAPASVNPGALYVAPSATSVIKYDGPGAAFFLESLGTIYTPSIVTPDTLFGASLKQWLRADLGTVSSWTDKSGNANHATQATAGLQPTIVASVVNGKPVYRFAAGNQMVNPLTVTNPATFIVVMKFTGATTFCDVYGAGTGMYSLQGSQDSGHNWGIYAAGPVSSTVPANAAFKACMVVARSTSDVDLVTTSTVVNVNPGATSFAHNFIGTDTTVLNDPGAFDIAEIIIVNRAITASERFSVLAYLQSLYGSV